MPRRLPTGALLHSPARGAQIRQARFRRRWWNGVDSGEVMTFLRHVAAELEELADELTAARDENARLKAAL